MIRAALTGIAIATLGLVTIGAAHAHEWFDAGFAFAVGIHYVRDLLPKEEE